MLSVKTVTASLSSLFAASFIICVLYGGFVPDSLNMHHFLETVLPGFKWLSIGTFFLGLIESVIWGIYIGALYSLLYNFFYKTFNPIK